MFVAEKFISGLTKVYDKHSVSTDGGTWYPQACRFLKLSHHIHSFPFWEKRYRKNNSIYKGQDGIIWWLFSMQKKEV